MSQRLNLQNTPDPTAIEAERVRFSNRGVELQGVVYKRADGGHVRPGVITAGAWTAVKEQMSGTYARELALRGFTALAFDFTGWGESGGELRFVEDPEVKTADLHAAADYLAGRADVDAHDITGLGICASSGYMAEVVADNRQLARLALVAPWLHDRSIAEEAYGGAASVAGLIQATEAAEGASDPLILTAASLTDETAPMYGAPYYTERDRGLIPEFDNKFSVLTWKPWLTYDGLASAERMTKPVLMVGSPSMALPVGAEAYERRTKAPLSKVWLGEDVSQFDFYDQADVVEVATDAVARFVRGEGS
ncbi:MAG: alpha/beta hydrolase [Myxococcota bacterium]